MFNDKRWSVNSKVLSRHLKFEPSQVHCYAIRNNGDNKNPQPEGEDGGITFDNPEWTNPSLSAKRKCWFGIEKRCHEKEVHSDHR